MKLGIYTNAADLQKTRPWTYTPEGKVYEPGEEKVVFHLRPWTRTTQDVVDRRAKSKNLSIMDAEDALKGIGQRDKKAEGYVRELADFLLADWEGVVYASNVPELNVKSGDPIPCTSENKVLLFEDVSLAADIVKAAKGFATLQIEDEAKNSERSSGGTDARVNSRSRASESATTAASNANE